MADAPISLQNNTLQPDIYLNKKDVNESHKTLGVFKSICGNQDDHMKFLQQKSRHIINSIQVGQINRRQARMAYNSNYLPAMLYSLAAMNFEESDLYNVQKYALFKFLQWTDCKTRFWDDTQENRIRKREA